MLRHWLNLHLLGKELLLNNISKTSFFHLNKGFGFKTFKNPFKGGIFLNNKNPRFSSTNNLLNHYNSKKNNLYSLCSFHEPFYTNRILVGYKCIKIAYLNQKRNQNVQNNLLGRFSTIKQ